MRNPTFDHKITNKFSNRRPGTSSDSSISTTPAAQTNPVHTFKATSIARSSKGHYKFGLIFALLLAIPLALIPNKAMVCQQDIHDSIPDCDSDTFTDYTTKTPQCTTIGNSNSENNDDDRFDTSSSVPSPGSTYLIRASSSGKLLTLDSGNVVLAQPAANGGSSIHVSIKFLEIIGPALHCPMLYTNILANSGDASKSKAGSISKTSLPVVTSVTISGTIYFVLQEILMDGRDSLQDLDQKGVTI